MTTVLRALWEARKAAGMAVGPKPRAVTRSACGPHKGCLGLLGRYRELVTDGEPEPAVLLGAVVRAKVAEQAERIDSPKHAEGHYATGMTICREQYWEGNLNAGRTMLENVDRDIKPANSLPVYVPPPLPNVIQLAAAKAASIKAVAMLKEGQRKANRARR